MKHKIEITLPTLPFDYITKDIVAYLQTAISELTGTPTEVYINDYDFTDKVDIFRNKRRPSHPNR